MMKTPTDVTPISCRLDLPDDFRIACLIHHFRHEKFLQNFIDHVSICASSCKSGREHYKYATRVVFQYLERPDVPFLMMEDEANRYLSKSHFQQVTRMLKTPDLNGDEKWQHCKTITGNWYKALKPAVVPFNRLRINDGILLTLPKDFCLLCEIFHFQPEAILQHFVNQICLPMAKAQITLDVEGGNPAMAFFFSATMGHTGIFKKNKMLPHHKVFVRNIHALQELDLWLFIVRDVAEREKVYRKFYDAWYQALLSEK